MNKIDFPPLPRRDNFIKNASIPWGTPAHQNFAEKTLCKKIRPFEEKSPSSQTTIHSILKIKWISFELFALLSTNDLMALKYLCRIFYHRVNGFFDLKNKCSWRWIGKSDVKQSGFIFIRKLFENLRELKKEKLIPEEIFVYESRIDPAEILKKLKNSGLKNLSPELESDQLELIRFLHKHQPSALHLSRQIDCDETIAKIFGMSIGQISKIYSNDRVYDQSYELFNFLVSKIFTKKIGEKDDFDNTIIFKALEHHNTVLLKFFASIKTPFDFPDHSGCTVLVKSILNKEFSLAKMLLNLKEVNIHTTLKGGASAIHFAAHEGWVEGVKILCEKGVCINEREYKGRTPLFVAVAELQHSLVEFLLKNKANPNIESQGITPIESVFLKDDRIVKLLLQHGAWANGGYEDGCLIHAAVKNEKLDLVQWLHEYGANLNIVNNKGQTPLVLAIEKESEKMVELLLMLGATVNTYDKNKDTPFSLAVQKLNVKIAKLLFKYGADINHAGKSGPPIYLACKAGRNVKLHWLLKIGADPKGLLFEPK